MSDSKQAPTVKVKNVKDLGYTGMNLSLVQRGTDLYETLRVGQPMSLELDGGAKVEATVTSMNVGPLIDHVGNQLAQNVLTYGRPSSPVALVHALTEEAGVDVLDVTKLYTVVTFTVNATQSNESTKVV